MTDAPSIDLSPLAQLLLVGAMLAALALGWLKLRGAGRTPSGWTRALTLLTLFLTFDLVLFGAFTRLTDSGLGCPDWPGCYGNASPVGAHDAISAAQTALPSGPVTHGKAWVEMVHRYLATGVGGLILVLAVTAWRRRRSATHAHAGVGVWWPTLTLLWVCVQGAFGALTVTMKLFPAIVTAHLLGGLLLLALLAVQAEHLVHAEQRRPPSMIDGPTRGILWVAGAVLLLQLALGGWVSTNYAVLACPDFPMCQGSWWPEMHFGEAFQLWRELGLTPEGGHISFAALTAMHFMHRLMAMVVAGVLGLLAWRLRRLPHQRPAARWIAWLVALQVATGMANVVLGWPLAAALLHTAGAAALVVVLTWVAASTRALKRAAPAISSAGKLDLTT